MFEKLGGRKLVFGIITLGVGLVIGHVKGDVPPNILSLLEFLFGSFVAGNSVGTVIGGIMDMKNPVSEVSSTETVDLAPLQDEIENLKAGNTSLAQGLSIVQQSLSLIIRRTGIDKMPEPPQS